MKRTPKAITRDSISRRFKELMDSVKDKSTKRVFVKKYAPVPETFNKSNKV